MWSTGLLASVPSCMPYWDKRSSSVAYTSGLSPPAAGPMPNDPNCNLETLADTPDKDMNP